MLQTLTKNLERLKEKKLSGKTGEKGFTLVEFLLVLAVVGVILAVSFIIYANVKRNSQAQSIAMEGRAVIAAVNSYLGNNGYKLPPCNTLDDTCPVSPYIDYRLIQKGWDYYCDTASGDGIIVSPPIDDPDVLIQVEDQLNDIGGGWDCGNDLGYIKCWYAFGCEPAP